MEQSAQFELSMSTYLAEGTEVFLNETNLSDYRLKKRKLYLNIL